MRHEDMQKEIGRFRHWHQQIEVCPGLVTPGTSNSDGLLRSLMNLGFPEDCRELRILDLGCRDGFFSFELERRGASVVPMDYAEPSCTEFPIAARLLGSSLEYVVENVYFLSPTEYGFFDHVLFLGLLYHLRNPMLALDRVRSVLKSDGTMWLETQLATDSAVLESSAPLWQFFPRDELNGDSTNMWGPNMAGLEKVVEECEFKVVSRLGSSTRGIVKARPVHIPSLRAMRELDSSAIRKTP